MISAKSNSAIETFLESHENADQSIKETPFGNILTASPEEILTIRPDLFGKAVVLLTQRDYYNIDTTIRFIWQKIAFVNLYEHLGEILHNAIYFIENFEELFLNLVSCLAAGWGMATEKLVSSQFNIFQLLFSASLTSHLSKSIKRKLFYLYLENLKQLDINKEADFSDEDFSIDSIQDFPLLRDEMIKAAQGHKKPIFFNRQCCILVHLLLMKELKINEDNSESISELYKQLKKFYKHEVLSNEFEHDTIPLLVYHFVVKFDKSLNFIDFSMQNLENDASLTLAKNSIKYLTRFLCTFKLSRDILNEFLHTFSSKIHNSVDGSLKYPEEVVKELCVTIFQIILCNQRSLLDNKRIYLSILGLPLIRICLRNSRPLDKFDKMTKTIIMRVFTAYNLNWQSLNLAMDFEELDTNSLTEADFVHLEQFGLIPKMNKNMLEQIRDLIIKRKFARRVLPPQKKEKETVEKMNTDL